MSELPAEYGVHPTIIHQSKRSLLDGGGGIFERGGKVAVAAEVAKTRSVTRMPRSES